MKLFLVCGNHSVTSNSFISLAKILLCRLPRSTIDFLDLAFRNSGRPLDRWDKSEGIRSSSADLSEATDLADSDTPAFAEFRFASENRKSMWTIGWDSRLLEFDLTSTTRASWVTGCTDDVDADLAQQLKESSRKSVRDLGGEDLSDMAEAQAWGLWKKVGEYPEYSHF